MLDWLSDPDNREAVREIQRHLRCTEAEAVSILLLHRLGESVDALGLEMSVWDDDDPDVTEE